MRGLIATHCEPVLDDEAEAATARRFLQTSTDHGLLRGRFALPVEDGEALLTALGRWLAATCSRTAAPPGSAGPMR